MEQKPSRKKPLRLRATAAISTLVLLSVIAEPAMAMTILLRLARGDGSVVQGTSKFTGHLDEIVVKSISMGVTNSGAGGGGGGSGSGAATFQDLFFAKSFDRSSPELFLSDALGRLYRTATFQFFDDPDKKGNLGPALITIELSEVGLASYKFTDTETSPAAAESIALAYRTIKVTDNISGQSSCWNIALNRSC